MTKPTRSLLPLILAAGFSASCGGDSHGHDHDGGHAHAAAFGGQVVELGDHFANLEVIHNAETGRLAIYTMDAHNENTSKSSTPELTVSVEAGGAEFDLTLAANTDTTKGNEEGASALFEVVDERLIGVETAHLTVASVNVRGKDFEDVLIHLGHSAADHDEDGGDHHGDGDHDEDGEGHHDGDDSDS